MIHLKLFDHVYICIYTQTTNKLLRHGLTEHAFIVLHWEGVANLFYCALEPHMFCHLLEIINVFMRTC